MATKKPVIKEPEETVVIEEQKITIKYDLNWYYMREKIWKWLKFLKI